MGQVDNDGGTAESPTEPQSESTRGSDPKRRRLALSSPIAILAVVAFVAWGIPVAQGFHFGCHVLVGDKFREVRLGIEMCRGENESERNAALAAQREAQEGEERTRRANEERRAQEARAEKQREEQTIEEERPAHEQAAIKLSAEAASLHQKAHHQELLAKADTSEAKDLEANASRVEGEETPEGDDSKYTQGENIMSQAENVQSHAEDHESAALSLKSEAESKEYEAAQERSRD